MIPNPKKATRIFDFHLAEEAVAIRYDEGTEVKQLSLLCFRKFSREFYAGSETAAILPKETLGDDGRFS
jgi:hypothetical protein